MNIPDEYWTTEVPTEPDVYVVKTADGRVDLHIPPRGSRLASLAGARFCRLALPAEVERVQSESDWRLEQFRAAQKLGDMRAAEVDRLKAENEKLREALRGLICICEREINMEQASRDIDAARAAIEGRAE